MTETHADVGDISPLGQRYLDGKLRGSQIQGAFELSQEGDLQDLAKLPGESRQRWLELGRTSLSGKVAFGVLAAGASSRMALKDLPETCRDMLAASGASSMPTSKALVPVYQHETPNGPEVLNFLDLFLRNVQQVRQRYNVANPALMLTSESNGDEIDSHLESVAVDDVLVFRQPLAPQIAATPADVDSAAKNFKNEQELAQAKQRAPEWAGREIAVGKPAGHGEFLHQLVASGMLNTLAQRGVEFITIRNIDNAAAVLNDDWLTLYGYALEHELDCLLEVCPRLPGQKGGALIRQNEQWRIAEDPSFQGTGHTATESCFINNAVALIRLDYLYKLYQTSAAELADASPEQRLEIADRGRMQFPVIVEAKPVKLSDGSVVGAVTPETNLWESTSVVQGAAVGAFAVPSERSVGDDFLQLEAAEQTARAQTVRFSPTKTWADFEDPTKQAILSGITRKLLEE